MPLPLAVKAVGGPTVGDLAARYLEEHVAVRVKPRTAVKARIAVGRQILPALGQVPLVAVERAQVVELQHKMSGTPSAANTAVKTLSHMYRLAAGWGMVPEGCNPCRSVARFPERKRERFLTDAEFARLGRVLDEAVTQGSATPPSVAVIRLLSLTGCRKNEILSLRWEDVDLDARELHLADAKTGPRTVQLPPMAVGILEGPAAPGGQLLGVSGPRPGTTLEHRQPSLARRAGQGRAGRCPAARSPTQLRIPGAGTRRNPAGDRQVAGPQGHRDDGAVRPSGAGLPPRGGGTCRRQHCSGYSLVTLARPRTGVPAVDSGGDALRLPRKVAHGRRGMTMAGHRWRRLANHNLKVVDSNPAPATIKAPDNIDNFGGFPILRFSMILRCQHIVNMSERARNLYHRKHPCSFGQRVMPWFSFGHGVTTSPGQRRWQVLHHR